MRVNHSAETLLIIFEFYINMSAHRGFKIHKYTNKIKRRHRHVRFVHFLTHMLGKLLLGLGIGALLVDQIEPYVFALLVVGVMFHFPFWYHVYIRG